MLAFAICMLAGVVIALVRFQMSIQTLRESLCAIAAFMAIKIACTVVGATDLGTIFVGFAGYAVAFLATASLLHYMTGRWTRFESLD